MAVSAGIDLMRGRPTPAIGSTEAKLQQRKLDALRRGVHRIADAAALTYGVHVVGVGGAGVKVVEQMLREAPADMLETAGSRLSVLAVDIGGESMAGVESLATNVRHRAVAHRDAVIGPAHTGGIGRDDAKLPRPPRTRVPDDPGAARPSSPGWTLR